MIQTVSGVAVTYVKYYGVRRLASGRWVVLTGDVNRVGALQTHYDLNYAKRGFAMKKAENFIKACHKPFTDFQDRKVTFKFKEVTQCAHRN